MDFASAGLFTMKVVENGMSQSRLRGGWTRNPAESVGQRVRELQKRTELGALGSERKKLVGEIGEGLVAEVVGALFDPRRRSNGILHLAAALGRGHACRTLLKEGHHDVDAIVCGGTPLMFIIEGSNSCEVVKLLLEHGANPNIACNHGRTPVLIASEKGYCKIAELLFLHGVIINCVFGDVENPLHIATENGDSQMLNLLLKHQRVGADDIKIVLMNLLQLAGSKNFSGCIDILLQALAEACNLVKSPRTSNTESTRATTGYVRPTNSTLEIEELNTEGDQPSSRSRSSDPATGNIHLQATNSNSIPGASMSGPNASFLGLGQSAGENGTCNTNTNETAEDKTKMSEKG